MANPASKIAVLALCVIAAHAQDRPQDRRIEPIVARKQVALVIGNAAYGNRPLSNPVNDARAMAKVLQGLNYDVILVTDADHKTMGRAIDQFTGKLSNGDVAFFYYSGHGIQVENENYLVPIDFQGKDESDARYDAEPASRIQDRMERSGAQLNIMVLDACRDNPYHSSSRSAASGLAVMNGGRGTFIAFATSPGKTASDNPGGHNGLFTQYLLEALPQPGLGLSEVFDLVRSRVDTASNGKQLPWTLSSVVGSYTFVPGNARVGTNASPGARPGPSPNANLPTPHLDPKPPSAPASLRSKVNPKDGLTYVWIPPGTFTMGCSPYDNECGPPNQSDEFPNHQVTLTKGFFLGESEVPQSAFLKVLGTNPSSFRGPNLPVENVTWPVANQYCQAIGGRIPTEAEWEYAARAGTTDGRYGDIDKIAWYQANSGGKTHEVKQKEPNAWGLYDMLGNVWEWVDDVWHDRWAPTPAVDPHGPANGRGRTIRGGSFVYRTWGSRASSRYLLGPPPNGGGLGLRCATE